jgi:hypothetical protein
LSEILWQNYPAAYPREKTREMLKNQLRQWRKTAIFVPKISICSGVEAQNR